MEIEGKMRLTDPEAIQHQLRELGAEEHGRIFETNTVFDTDDGLLKSGDRGLRIRVEQREGEEPVVTITHKGPRAHGRLKNREETEVRVSDAQESASLLEALGYRPVLTFEKRRQRFELDACQIELDTLPLLGDFIEIEGPSGEAVMAVREKLELAESELVRTSYAAMLTAHLRENNLRTHLIRFEDENNHTQPNGDKVMSDA
jgi:adenylate cyclase class 2